jgi:primosomal protein N' (replication factor Y)
MKSTYINVAIPGTPRRLFTYGIPEEMYEEIEPGHRCLVPFGKRRVIGYYIGQAEHKPGIDIKQIMDFVERHSLFSRELHRFILWMADYYYANPADVFHAAIPPELRRIRKSTFYVINRSIDTPMDVSAKEKLASMMERNRIITGRSLKTLEKESPGITEKLVRSGILKESWAATPTRPIGIIRGYKIDDSLRADSETLKKLGNLKSGSGLVRRSDISAAGISSYRFNKLVKQGILTPVHGMPDIYDYLKARPGVESIDPNEEQGRAIERISGRLGSYAPFLLYGITGSGKTLVYCHIARKVIASGKSVLILVPEIALAGTLLSYFKGFFKDEIALLHSALRPQERVFIWQTTREGKYKIIIGARSAIFAPLERIGMIIVDEEHDESYKQDRPAPRFQARDAAVMRAKMAGIPVVMGSATPALESYYNARSGRYELLQLTRRPEKAAVPMVRLIDLKKERPPADNPFFTRTLISKIKEALSKNNQVILYLNRRGFSPRIKCLDCGHTPLCRYCNISLAYHKSGNKLMCHYCGFVTTGYDTCEKCKGEKFIYLGTGTQKIEENIGRTFTDARLLRLDSDTAGRRRKAHLILADFAARKSNLLLGTQMVTKGIDFPDVSIVGVLMADIGLDMPDFRAAEKLFAKLIQVAGRSGRGIIPGEVIIQTYKPDLELIDDAARQDYDSFYLREIESRRRLQYPPFSHLVNFRFSAKKEDVVRNGAAGFRERLEARLRPSGLKATLLGPAACPLFRQGGLFRRQLFVKTTQILRFTRLLDAWEQQEPGFGLPSKVKIAIDIDPYDMM